MFCKSCANLALINAIKTCLRCKGSILDNLSVICSECSQTNNLCSICLKKIYTTEQRKRFKSNCSSCGK